MTPTQWANVVGGEPVGGAPTKGDAFARATGGQGRPHNARERAIAIASAIAIAIAIAIASAIATEASKRKSLKPRGGRVVRIVFK